MSLTDRQTSLLVAVWVLTPIVIFTIGLRMYTSITVLSKVDAADWCMISAVVGSTRKE